MIKRFFFLLLLGAMGLSSLKGEARLDPASHAMLSDPAYAEHIEVQCYLVTREQVADLFSKKNGSVAQLPCDKLYLNEVYLLVRCKNNGNYRVFGTLHCFIPNRGDPIPIDIDMMNAHMNSFHDCVIYVISGVIDRNNKLPQINYQWDCLYKM